MQKLAQEFVCCTEEVDILFPRNEWLIKHLKNDPAVKLFRDTYGKQVPREHWDPSPTKTKQGVYAMMPDGTYLSARFVGTRKDQVIDLLNEALTTWREQVKERGLKPKPVPQTAALQEWESQKKKDLGLLLQMHCRDLPREGANKTGHGRVVGEQGNTTWLEFSKTEALTFVPDGEEWQAVSSEARDKLFRKGLKDIVYGQSPDWKPADIQSGSLKVRRQNNLSKGINVVIELAGEFHLQDGSHSYRGKISGRVLWLTDRKKITRFEAVAIGARQGSTTFNFRKGDEAAAPLGVSFFLGE
ncbi:hypothetical protein [Oceaniferula spumae]|uniref:hypothetical protein n=1 Tax=Oceaniferula spumae TaxID=2979115 RepID=UPI003F4F145E